MGIRRRVSKKLKKELAEIDYHKKLSPAEYEYLVQFMFEYYQADFNFNNPLHRELDHIKDCRDRNNAERRQWHSVGSELKAESVRSAVNRNSRTARNHVYTPDDYNKELSYEDLLEKAVWDEESFYK